MKSILPLVLLMFLLQGAVVAQLSCPPNRLEDCPPEGCAAWDKQLNIKKNFVPGRSTQTPERITLEEIKQLAYPAQWYAGKERLELEKLGEGRLVQVTAYLIDVKEGQISSANCKLAEFRLVNKVNTLVSVNDLLVLVSEDALKRPKGQREAESVMAEITPRLRTAHSKFPADKQTTNWTASKLRALMTPPNRKPVLVRVTGLLLLDTEPMGIPIVADKDRKIHRYTDWEIHPVLDISVCLKANKCTEAEWPTLDSMNIIIPPPIRRKDGPIIKGRPRIKTRR